MPDIIHEYFVAYGLYKKGWTFKFGRSKKDYARTWFNRKHIVFSVPAHEIRNEDWFRDTVAHEVAHVITNDRCHGPKWIIQAKKMGVSTKGYE